MSEAGGEGRYETTGVVQHSRSVALWRRENVNAPAGGRGVEADGGGLLGRLVHAMRCTIVRPESITS